MAGHNRWSKIKRQKAAMGNTKGKLFTKVIKEITVAARMGGGDPSGNARLRAAMDAARAANMPSDNIVRAVKKGTGELEGADYEEIVYEGHGPGGTALLVECLTDNRNRTVGEVRHLFSKGGGNMGETGSVGWMFDRRGIIEVRPGPDEERVMELAIEAGAVDVIPLGEEGFEVQTEPADLHEVAAALAGASLELGERKLGFIAKNNLSLAGEQAELALRLVDLLEDCDDVQEVHGNFDIVE
jgi:YebC/PmpR family DNA-binding regulatory protein